MEVTPKQTAETLRQWSVEARQRAESHANAIRARAIGVVRGQLPPGGRAWLIGSLAWGGFGERSDVDVVLDGVEPTLATSIEVALCRSLQVEVDLLTFKDLPPSFRTRVEQEGIAVHGQPT